MAHPNPAGKRDRFPSVSSKSSSSSSSSHLLSHKEVAILEPDQVWSVRGRDERTSELAWSPKRLQYAWKTCRSGCDLRAVAQCRLPSVSLQSNSVTPGISASSSPR